MLPKLLFPSLRWASDIPKKEELGDRSEELCLSAVRFNAIE